MFKIVIGRMRFVFLSMSSKALDLVADVGSVPLEN